MLQFCINTRDTTHTHIYHGGSGGSFRARPEAEPTEAIHSHAIYVICIAFHASCKPSGTKSLEAFFHLYIYASVLYQHKRHNTYTYISRRKWGKFPGSSRGGTHGCHTLTCHMCHMYCISKSSIDSGAQASIKNTCFFSFPLLHENLN